MLSSQCSLFSYQWGDTDGILNISFYRQGKKLFPKSYECLEISGHFHIDILTKQKQLYTHFICFTYFPYIFLRRAYCTLKCGEFLGTQDILFRRIFILLTRSK